MRRGRRKHRVVLSSNARQTENLLKLSVLVACDACVEGDEVLLIKFFYLGGVFVSDSLYVCIDAAAEQLISWEKVVSFQRVGRSCDRTPVISYLVQV